jgi:chromate reductase, NAD(P)H dehydrogenase (quinone)
MTNILFVSGSLRAASATKALAVALAERIKDDANCTLANIGKLPHYNSDLTDHAEVTAWINTIQAADGLVFVTPEYNYSIPGVLKNAIDWASRPAMKSVFANKNCLVISASAGALGGVRAQSHLKYILNGMLAKTYICPEIVVPAVTAKVESGTFTDESVLSFTEDNLRGFLAALNTA